MILMKSIPVVTYHSIDESNSVISTSVELFCRQMKHLTANGYTTITMGELSLALDGKLAVPEKPVALTFDDGFQNFRTHAFPVIQDLGIKATVFLVTDYCGQTNDWEPDGFGIPRQRLLSWPEIKELAKAGIEFGSHTRTHPDLTKVSPSELESEIVGSRSAIEDSIGQRVDSFAYPFGKYESESRRVAARTYAVACSTKLGKARERCDKFSIERIDAYYLKPRLVFESMPARKFDAYLKVRRVLRDMKTWAVSS